MTTPLFTDLQQFVAALRQKGDLVEIHAEVDPYLEAPEIHRRVIDRQGPAILFHRIKGSPFPLVTNLFGTKARVDLAFGNRPMELVRQIAKLPEELMPPTLPALWEKRSLFGSLAKIGLKRKRYGEVTDVIETPSKLGRLPLLTTWQEDGGPFVTLPLVYTEHPGNGTHNLGMYRVQRYDDQTTGLHFQIGKGAGFHLKEAEARGENLPVNITIGGPPALIMSAIAPLPENVPELMLASLLMGKKLEMAKNPIGPLPVVGSAEFVMSGYCVPQERRLEGPFGDHYGYYSLAHDYPVFHCEGLLRKKSPLCAATVVGKPRQEDFFIGDYLQELLSPLFPLVMPAVEDLWSYGETGFHSLAAARVKQRYKREAMVSAFRILGEGQLALTKFLMLIDAPIPLQDFSAVLEHVLARCDFRTDLYVFSNLSMDTLDYTGPEVNEGSKGVMMGLGEPIRTLPDQLPSELPRYLNHQKAFCRGCLVVQGASYSEDKECASRISEDARFSEWPLIVLVDDVEKATAREMDFLWTTFTRFEPAADMYAHTEVRRHHMCYHPPVVIDARMKPWYPDELECDEDTRALVDKRWREYFPKGVL